ncbi:MAG: TIR domain-containing protein [Clostridiales bacterium]|nr:TIR domain-containing protein [Clostridiales bacterium]
MAKLSYKTRGNSSPQGKGRVYFACHPKDFKVYFEQICEDIFKTQNCAIWYDADPEEEWDAEDMEIELGRMQLFVIPVTSRFLFRKNKALDTEFGFTLEHHIPILPLMQEDGLEKDFNRICGNLQFLGKNAASRDLSATPYEIRLSQFLSSILLGDELMAMVREAFKAYIFMSYRKKDRKQAQELMHLIHQNDFCRDIAIWYDEFLLPGENFNDSIAAAMKKSEMFAMVVTPNLVNETNYVMTTEYPAARESGKSILPAEMEVTDPAALREHYGNLPAVTDAHNAPALSKALLERICKAAVTENDDAPEHLYFIGLAYLNGIDVETDSKRGVELIKRSAEQEVPDAIEKMSEMFWNGEGVERNYEEANRWMERLKDYWRQQYSSYGRAEDGWALASTLSRNGDKQKELGYLESAKKKYCAQLSVMESLGNDLAKDIYLSMMSYANANLGEISFSLGKFEEAKKYYKNAYVLSDELKGESNAELQYFHALSGDMLGMIYEKEGKFAESRKWHEDAYYLIEALNDELRTPESRGDLSRFSISMGSMYLNEGNFTEARKWYKNAYNLQQELTEELESQRSYRELSRVSEYLGGISELEGNITEAKEWYKKAYDLGKNLNSEIETGVSRRDYAIYCRNLGRICEKESKIKEAREWYVKSHMMFKELDGEINTIQSRHDLSAACENLGRISCAGDNLTEARKWYEESFELRIKIQVEVETFDSIYELFCVCETLGQISEAEGNLAEARKWYEQVFKLKNKISEEQGTFDVNAKLFSVCESLGRISEEEGDFSEAKKMYEESYKLRDELNHMVATKEPLHDLSRITEKLGWICERENNYAEARRWYEELYNLVKEMNKENRTPETRRELAIASEYLGDINEKEGNFSEAKKWYKKSCNIGERLDAENNTMSSRRDLIYFYNNLGRVCEEEGKIKEAMEWYTKARVVSRKV